jgi:hypothetical protein
MGDPDNRPDRVFGLPIKSLAKQTNLTLGEPWMSIILPWQGNKLKCFNWALAAIDIQALTEGS